jgi:hypothetical protein
MTITIAIINEWAVTEIVTIDSSEYQQYASSCQLAIDITDLIPQPQTGWIFNGSQLISNGVNNWQITKLAFRERFTAAELIGIIAASAQQNTEGFTLQMIMQNQALATYVDLSRTDTVAGVEVLVSFGLLTSDRANQILTTVPTTTELYQG